MLNGNWRRVYCLPAAVCTACHTCKEGLVRAAQVQTVPAASKPQSAQGEQLHTAAGARTACLQQLCSHCHRPSPPVRSGRPLQPTTPTHFRTCPLQPLTGLSPPPSPFRPCATHALSCCFLRSSKASPQPQHHTNTTPHRAFAAGLSGSAGMNNILCTRSARLSRPGCVADQARR